MREQILSSAYGIGSNEFHQDSLLLKHRPFDEYKDFKESTAKFTEEVTSLYSDEIFIILHKMCGMIDWNCWLTERIVAEAIP